MIQNSFAWIINQIILYVIKNINKYDDFKCFDWFRVQNCFELMYTSIVGVQMFYTAIYDVLSHHLMSKNMTCDVLANDLITDHRLHV